jgi:hypothetical protein
MKPAGGNGRPNGGVVTHQAAPSAGPAQASAASHNQAWPGLPAQTVSHHAPVSSPPALPAPRPPQGPQHLTVSIPTTGDLEQDKRRLRRVHGLLTSYPGHDRFTLVVYERQRPCEVEFPNDTTGYCQALVEQLYAMLGPETVSTRAMQ